MRIGHIQLDHLLPDMCCFRNLFSVRIKHKDMIVDVEAVPPQNLIQFYTSVTLLLLRFEIEDIPLEIVANVYLSQCIYP